MRGQLRRSVQTSQRPASSWLKGAAALVLLAHLVGGCSLPLGDLPLVGMPENTPPRTDTPVNYLPVNDVPGPRGTAILTPEEQDKIEKELAAARDRQAESRAKMANEHVSQ